MNKFAYERVIKFVYDNEPCFPSMLYGCLPYSTLDLDNCLRYLVVKGFITKDINDTITLTKKGHAIYAEQVGEAAPDHGRGGTRPEVCEKGRDPAESGEGVQQGGPEKGCPLKEEVADRMLRWFEYQHLPPHLQDTSRPFAELAYRIISHIKPGPERTVALRKLLESKDAAVRAALHPGG